MAGRGYVASKLYSLRAVFASICCSVFSILSVFRMYISGMYTAIAVTRNMHQIAARKYCCIRSLPRARSLESTRIIFCCPPAISREKHGVTSHHNWASYLGIRTKGAPDLQPGTIGDDKGGRHERSPNLSSVFPTEEEEEDPAWTLQYALQDDSAENATGQVLAPARATRE